MASDANIDEDLYSRQLYVLGHEAQRRMAASNVLIVGLTGLGVEVAKNIVLAGVKSVSIADDEIVAWGDLAAQFYLSEGDVGKRTRAEATIAHLSELNPYVAVHKCGAEVLDGDELTKFQVVVLVDQPSSLQLEVDTKCHNAGVRFLAASSRGVFGWVFADYGPEFVVLDDNGEPPRSVMVAAISKDSPAAVTCLDEQRHDLVTGEFVQFSEVKGMTELNDGRPRKITVSGPYTFTIEEDVSGYGNYESGGWATQVKMPRTVAFMPLREAQNSPEYVTTDFAKMDRQDTITACFQALDQYLSRHGEPPRAGSAKDADAFVQVVAEVIGGDQDAPVKEVAEAFARTCRGAISPIAAMLGGLVGQEIMKAISGKFGPLKQFLTFDCMEMLPTTLPDEEACAPKGSRYDGQIAVVGGHMHYQIANLRYFLVGAGAIGCEMLKNWAMMGIGSGPEGKIYVTDMDQIEKSNLSRQFLFRDRDIKKAKSTAAAAAVQAMNGGVKIEAFEERVGPETEGLFDDTFWSSLSGVCNALDNVQARLYVDQKCVFYKKSLLESGTLGTKGNSQVVVPNLTESYGSSRDPPEKSIPICTLKNFPYQIEHTLQWARDQFEGYFKAAADEVNDYLSRPEDYVENLRAQGAGQMRSSLETVYTTLVKNKATRLEDCVSWARLSFDDLFTSSIKQLLYSCPPDMTDRNGVPFWSGTKRCPKPIEFDANDELHLGYVYHGACLRAETCGIDASSLDLERTRQMVAAVEVAEFRPKEGVKVATTEAQAEQQGGASVSNDDDEAIEVFTLELAKVDVSQEGHKMNPLSFEKDDDSNHHIDFITACSNLRATNYSIEPADRHTSKRIAGKIIPAIATTTAYVTGCVCVELCKLVRMGYASGSVLEENVWTRPQDAKAVEERKKDEEAKLAVFKNGFANLALPFFAFSEPMPAPKEEMGKGRFWTLWDRFDVDVGEEFTLDGLLSYFKDNYALEITMISCGISFLYSSFTSRQKLKDRGSMKISDIAQEVGKLTFHERQQYLVLEVCCDDESGEDVEVPYIRYRFRW